MRWCAVYIILFVAGVRAQDLLLPEIGVETAEATFTRLDSNKDNAVTPDEYLHVHYAVAALQKSFDAIDANHDKMVTLDEIKAFEKQEQEKRSKEFREGLAMMAELRLKEYDVNKNAILEADELKKYFEMRHLKTDKLPEISKPFDANNDGKFNVNELAEMQYNFV